MPIHRTRDAELTYTVSGGGEPLLLLHGLGSSSEDWAPQVEAFSAKYRVITVDARGHGRTRVPASPEGPWTVRDMAADVASLLEMLGCGPAHVVGLSMGGMIAFQLVVDAPQLVRTLTIVNSGPALVPKTLRERLFVAMRFILIRTVGLRGMGRALAPKLFPKPEHEALRAQFVERVASCDTRAYLAALRAIVGWSVADRLAHVKQPTLIVAADQDYTPVEVKRAYAAQMPSAEVVVLEDARHAAPVECPERFNAVLASFLARHAAPSRAGNTG